MKENKNTAEIPNFDSIFDYFKKNDSQIEYFGKTLGKGLYSEVREVKLKNSEKKMAAKLVKKENDNLKETELVQELRGNNIIKMNKIISREINGEDYDLIIMEKEILRDLGKLTEFYYKHNLLKLIIEDPFDQKIGDNFLTFYAKQIIDGLETLDRNYFVHFDIKPENLLITINLNIKLSDFGLITKVRDGGGKIKIPEGTQGFLTKEYFNKEKVTADVARKQDYFALGSTLFYLKYGEYLLKYKKFDEPMLNAERIMELLNIKIAYIRSRKESDQEFIDFLTSLLHYNPDERPSFEQIYRNKWVNANREELELITSSNINDEEKVIMELQKSDYLINKEKELPKKKQNFRFKKKNN